MATLTAPGIGSGLDIATIIDQLMEVERQPLLDLVSKEAEIQAEISAMGTIKGALSSFQSSLDALEDADVLNALKAQSSDDEVLSATASAGAATGSYVIDVTRLAQPHKFGSDAKSNSYTVGGDTAADALTIEVDGKELKIDLSSAKTLAEIRDAINTDTGGVGVKATLLNENEDGTSQRLILTAQDTGYENRLQLSFSGNVQASDFGATPTTGFSTLNKDENDVVISDLNDLDAEVAVDGFTVTRGSNTLDDVLDDVTLNLTKVGSTTLSVELGGTDIVASVSNVVDAYNTLQSELSAVPSSSGDIVRGVQRSIRSALNDAFNGLGDFSTLVDLGVTNTKEGVMQLDSNKLGSAIAANRDDVVAFFADESGLIASLNATLNDVLSTNGSIETRTDRLETQVDRIQDRQAELESNLLDTEERIRREYTALDGLLSQLDATSRYLQQQLDSLNNLATGNQNN